MKVTGIPVAKIRLASSRRAAAKDKVESLAESIREIGLQHPVGVVSDKLGYLLIHGRHRLAAYKLLSRDKIPAVVHNLDKMHAELAEIDENIIRSGLSKAEESKALARRKEIYEALHPEAKRGVAGGKTGGRGREKIASDKLSFAIDTAAKTGKSKRTVERDAALGAKLDDKAVAKLHGHPLADNKTELAKLAAMPAKEQREVAIKLARGQLQRVPGGEPSTADEPDDDTGDTFWQDMEDVLRERLDTDGVAVVAARLENLAEKFRQA